jgi:hypothetical protein
MDTVAPAAPRRGLTPVQKSMYLQLLLVLAWSAGLLQLFHTFRVVFVYMVTQWMITIAILPIMPLPWWRVVLSTFVGAVLISLLYYGFWRLGWP